MQKQLDEIICGLKENSIKKLDLSRIIMCKEAVGIIANCLKSSTSLKIMDLSNQSINWNDAMDLISAALINNSFLEKIIVNNNPNYLSCMDYPAPFEIVYQLARLISESSVRKIECNESYLIIENPLYPIVMSFKEHPIWQQVWTHIQEVVKANKKKNTQDAYVRGSMIGFFKKLNLPPELGRYCSKFISIQDARNIAQVSKSCADLASEEIRYHQQQNNM